jgi:hypothetical protein
MSTVHPAYYAAQAGAQLATSAAGSISKTKHFPSRIEEARDRLQIVKDAVEELKSEIDKVQIPDSDRITAKQEYSDLLAHQWQMGMVATRAAAIGEGIQAFNEELTQTVAEAQHRHNQWATTRWAEDHKAGCSVQ